MNILDRIRETKRAEIKRQKEEFPLSRLQRALSLQRRPTLSLREALAASPSGIIAEFKRRSPSRGWIHPGADVAHIARAYEEAGAAAISCLTDEEHFGGSIADFEKARDVVTRVPLLRKEFILDEYQVYQSKVMGADAILLIAACLTRDDARRLADMAHFFDMEVLLEIRDERELDYIQPNIDVVGVNNRDLANFQTDTTRSATLAAAIPPSRLKIAESGINDPRTIIDLRRAGFRGFLVGEYLMRERHPGQALEQLVKATMP
ncbi:MAG: indole-3-glycerol phosphate synthase TrpC [Odoribacteraceae bacterium]|jgi:indole-3-glycerol phosphate synthase|nr:indole-3-glycerol phosphate synthase TrpC [Odoribacteraceae bacterium]